ncbi:MAG: hypothetical protein OEM82_08580 [Acidobacteriota bacterium]|nr:hypothetical protein [Acidobacteriota bacterium]MDH3530833.1 hypothetical protein [Acidobacteriota bacterium]
MNPELLDIRRKALSPTQAINDAWSSIGGDYWFYFGISIVAWLIAMASGMIPGLSIIIGPIVTGPLFAGVFAVFLAKADGEKKEFGAMFDGFKRFQPTVIIGLILSIPGILLQIYQLVALVSDITGMLNPDTREAVLQQSAFPPALIGLYVFMIVFGLTVGLLLFFSYYLIMDRGMGAVDAIKASSKGVIGNFGRLIVLIFLEGLLMLAGVLACGVGLLFVAPVLYLANANAYRQVFPGSNLPARDPNPPDPNVYGDSFGQIA